MVRSCAKDIGTSIVCQCSRFLCPGGSVGFCGLARDPPLQTGLLGPQSRLYVLAAVMSAKVNDHAVNRSSNVR